MPADDVIRSQRLELPLLALDQLDRPQHGRGGVQGAVDRPAAGDGASVGAELHAILPIPWLDEVRWLAGMRAQQLRLRPADAPWLLRAILLRTTEGAPQAIGYLNFHAGPDERGMVEVGYTLYLPAEYKDHPDKRYPVLYYLHGRGGTESSNLGAIKLLDALIKCREFLEH